MSIIKANYFNQNYGTSNNGMLRSAQRVAKMDFFEEGILGSEGSEQERYVTIYFKLKNGATEASDE